MVSSVDYFFEKTSTKKEQALGVIVCRFRSGKNVRRMPMGIYLTEDDWSLFSQYYETKGRVTEEQMDGVTKQDGGSAMLSTIGITYERLAYVLDDIRTRLLGDEELRCTNSVVPLIVNTRIAIHLIDVSEKFEIIKRKRMKSISLIKCMEQIISEKASGQRLKERDMSVASKRYVQKFRLCIRQLQSFERVHGEKITLEDVTMQLRDEYIDWCHKKNYSANYIFSLLEAVHCVMKIAYEEKLTENAIHAHRNFVPKKERVGNILLSSQQLQQMYELDLSSSDTINALVEKRKIGKRKMEKYKPLLEEDKIASIGYARDIFIVGCLTGQRYSDYRRLSADMITEMNGLYFAGIVQQKTGAKVVIPLDERVVDILRKYEDGLPDLSIYQVNECLHLIGELLGWTWRPDFNGNAPRSQAGARFCDLLSSHTARRSFATNAYAQRVPVESIMAVTGHKSEFNLRMYVRDAPEASASVVADDFDGFLEL